MKTNNLFILIILAIYQFTFAEITLDDVINGVEIRQDLIKSAKLDFDYQYHHPANQPLTGNDSDYEIETKKILDYNYKTLRKDNKVRVSQIKRDLITGENLYLQQVAWDGEVQSAYVKKLTDLDEQPSGTIKNKMGSSFGYWTTPMEMRVFDMKEPLPNLFKKSSLELNGFEKIGNYEAVKLTATNFFGEIAVLEAWIAPKKDFAPVRLRLVYHMPPPKKDIILTMDNVKLENKNGVRVIMESDVKVVNPNVPQQYAGEIGHYKAQDYQVNIPIDDEMFKINFPNGTSIYDSILEIGYVTGEGMFIGDGKGGGEYVSFEISPKVEKTPARQTLPETQDVESDSSIAPKTSFTDDQAPDSGDSSKIKNSHRTVPIYIIISVIIALLILTLNRKKK